MAIEVFEKRRSGSLILACRPFAAGAGNLWEGKEGWQCPSGARHCHRCFGGPFTPVGPPGWDGPISTTSTKTDRVPQHRIAERLRQDSRAQHIVSEWHRRIEDVDARDLSVSRRSHEVVMKNEADIASQLAELRNKARFVLRFITESAAEERVFWDEFERVIDVAYAEGDARGLRGILSDLTQWARSLPNDRRKELDALLETEFGSTITDLYKPIRDKINQVLERGVIRTPAEYRLLEERASEIYDDPANKAELDRLNELLVMFYGGREK
jgi:hypothetical protein